MTNVAVPSTFVEWAVVVLMGGGGLKFIWDLVLGRPGRRKTDAEGHVLLVGSAAEFAQKTLDALTKTREEFEEYRDEQEERWKRLDRQRRIEQRMARAHNQWDQKIVDRLERMGEVVEPPPPLYVEEN